MSHTMRPHMYAVVEEMEAHRSSYGRAMALLDAVDLEDRPECWRTAEDCANGFKIRDEFLARHEDK